MKKPCIYIVEDEALVAKDIENSLKGMGFAVAGTADSGEKALADVGKNRPDLVLMDIRLKGGLNGIEAASKIRSLFSIPVIYLTAHANEEMLQNAKLTEPFGYILKPFEERELGSTIDIALYRHKMEKKAQWESEVNKTLSTLYKPLISSTSSIEEMAAVVLDSAESLTRSEHGYISAIDPHTGDLVVHVFSEMMKDACKISSREKKVLFHRGKDGRYPSLWGHALNKREAFFTNRPENHSAYKGIPADHLSLHRFLTVPVFLEKELAGQIALANKEEDYTEEDIHAVVRIAEFYALAIQKFRAGEALQKAYDQLEERVRERTADLAANNATLRKEIETRMEAESSLRDNQEILRAFLDSIPEPAFLMEISGKIIMANKALPKRLGMAGEQLIGKNLNNFLPREAVEEREPYVAEIVRKKEPLNFEMTSGPNTFHHYMYPVFDSQGAVTRVADLCFDVTLRKQMEMQLIQSEKLASIGVLVSGVAHEINNPNNFITFNIPILRDYLFDLLPIIDEYAERHGSFEPLGMTYPEFRADLFKILDNIEHGAGRINRTVSELRDFSRKKEKPNIVSVDIKDVFEKAVSISQDKVKGRVKTLRVSVPEDMPRIQSDPDTIEQIVINLLINAAQASDKEDSWVEIEAKLEDSQRNRFIIEVKDNGSGMNKKTMRKVFEPFFTTKPRGEGTGLGLSLCHNLASSLGGKIELESEPGKGSAFRLVLPDNKLMKINEKASL
jgi:PAS domain S-box-containing protein